VAVADEDEGAGPRLQHVGEILAAHQRRYRPVDAGFARDRRRDVAGKHRLAGIVDGDWIVRLVLERYRRVARLADALADRLLAVSGDGRHFLLQRAHRAGKLDMLRNDVIGVDAV